jgi:hypothetical protein
LRKTDLQEVINNHFTWEKQICRKSMTIILLEKNRSAGSQWQSFYLRKTDLQEVNDNHFTWEKQICRKSMTIILLEKNRSAGSQWQSFSQNVVWNNTTHHEPDSNS